VTGAEKDNFLTEAESTSCLTTPWCHYLFVIP